MASYCSVESLKESTPFRIPPWDRSSTELCFARSHAILTKHHPTLYSVDELNGNTVDGRESPASSTRSSLPEGILQRYLKQNMNSTGSVDFACDSEYELSRISEISKDGVSVSSYDWVFKSPKAASTASSETLIDENSSDDQHRMVVATSQKVMVRRRSSASFPNSPRKHVKRGRSCKSTPMRRPVYRCSSSESEYETAPCKSNGSSTSKYTMPRGSSSSDDDFAHIMRAFIK